MIQTHDMLRADVLRVAEVLVDKIFQRDESGKAQERNHF